MTYSPMIVLSLVATLQVAGSQQLIGRWDSLERSRGGLGGWIELSANGTSAATIGAMVDGRWTLEGDQLTLDIGLPDGKSEVVSATVSISGNAQTQVRGKDSYRLTRIDKGDGAPLVGVWKYAHPAGGEAYEEYTPEGRHFSLAVEGEVLMLRSGGQLSRFRRERAGILPRSPKP